MQLDTLLRTHSLTGVALVAVSVDTQVDSGTLIERAKLQAVLLLEDRDHQVIDRYGLLDYTLWAPVPYPATYVIDRQGIVRWRFVEQDFRVRASPEDVLCVLQKLEQTATIDDCHLTAFEPGFSSPGK